MYQVLSFLNLTGIQHLTPMSPNSYPPAKVLCNQTAPGSGHRPLPPPESHLGIIWKIAS